MGMAASQARYLALTARKTNTEYEGQQINQARTALSNQSANLFNQLLDLEVPTAPKTTDYTEVQYSYSDGQNESVLEDWQQLSTADPEYNYIVNHYYYSNIFTGSQKYLQNPEVTEKGVVNQTDIKTPTVTYTTDKSGNQVIEIEGSSGTKRVYTSLEGLQKSNTLGTNDRTNLDNALQDFQKYKGLYLDDGTLDKDNVYGWQDENNTWHFTLKNEIKQDETDPTQMSVPDYATEYKPAAVGNCPLTEVTEEDYANAKNADMKATLEQIVKDCPDTNLANCFTNDHGDITYNGGVYSFQMNGQTYYTCEKDLYNSLQTNYPYDKTIENQDKLAYYTASDIKTKIEETNKALLETDGSGRFTSVKFDDDSLVYQLNTETVTDDAAYEDAMNEYNYKVQQYEKTIADINAQTSIIQQEDRTLELRLKQLETEQLALKTEMDAVKSVIKNNVETTFKTFSD